MEAALTEDVWSAQATTPDAVESALREMLRKRHQEAARLVPARVLNLVVVVDAELRGEVSGRLERIRQYHPSRTVICSVRSDGDGSFDARAVLAYNQPADGGSGPPGVIREQVDLRVGVARIGDLGAIVDPILLSELPTVLWCPHGHLDQVESLLAVSEVVLIDSDDEPEPAAALDRSASLAESVYVVDLAWLRTTPWRERLAATYDPPYRRAELACLTDVCIRHRAASAASAALLAGWLNSRLRRSLNVQMAAAEQDVPGLAGVTVTSGDGFSLSLDRAPGGLRARRRRTDGTESSWQVLGASRGEGGILGEGVRQALLYDPTYNAALRAARELLAA
jgi:glucose-6-phosphate dehydrogenase assembly protein OpcA